MTKNLKTWKTVEERDNQLWICVTDRMSKAAGLAQGIPIKVEVV